MSIDNNDINIFLSLENFCTFLILIANYRKVAQKKKIYAIPNNNKWAI